MARLFTSGFELNSASNGIEFSNNSAGVSVQSSIKRSGGFAGRINTLTSGAGKTFRYDFKGSNVNGPIFARTYFYYTTLPSAANAIISLSQANNANELYIKLGSDATLTLFDEDGQIGSASSALTVGTWYRVEMKIDVSAASGSHVGEAMIDGAVFATASNRAISAGVARFSVGGNILAEAQTTADWYFDDMAVNDATGAAQTSYPGAGSIILLSPNAAGDSNQWLNTAGGAGDANNYTLVDEIPPNGATDLVKSSTNADVDLYNISASGIGASDTVNVVQLGVQYNNDTADATTAFKVELEKAASGTKAQSSAIIPNSVSFVTNANAEPRTSPLITYLDPDSAVWTQATLDSMQAGIIVTAVGTNKVQVSALWVYVDYTPLVGSQKQSIFGDGQLVY